MNAGQGQGSDSEAQRSKGFGVPADAIGTSSTFISDTKLNTLAHHKCTFQCAL